MDKIFDYISLPAKPDAYAPDGSEIRLLTSFQSGSLCHCTLPGNGISRAIKHKTIEEIWFCTSGEGVVWQKNNSESIEVAFQSGDSFTIPAGNCFQFRNTGKEPLCIIIVSMPKWPGPDEAILVEGIW